MARIAGVNIPQNKIVQIGLTYIHGIGDKFSKQICKDLEISWIFLLFEYCTRLWFLCELLFRVLRENAPIEGFVEVEYNESESF